MLSRMAGLQRSFASASQPAAAGIIREFVPKKSPGDRRDYKFISLKNKLDVLLVTDPHTEKSAASMDCRVGHFSDPAHLAGLAHFCEHMLFLGTEKYPQENSYSQFLSTHGGSSNAYTFYVNTNYYFNVRKEFLGEAVDRFSQFFIAPLFDENSTEREVNAVHNEFSKNLQVDSRRLHHLIKHVARPEHAFSKFGTGNLDTLWNGPAKAGIDIRAALLDFHKQHYSANVMKLCILGAEPLETLQAWAVEMFAGVENTEAKPTQFGHDVFARRPGDAENRLPEEAKEASEEAATAAAAADPMGVFGRRLVRPVLKLKTVKDLRSIQLLWPLPSQHPHYRTGPLSVLGHLVGHESEGSILHQLKAEGLANAIYAGEQYAPTQSFSAFSVTVTLTPKGFELRDRVVEIIHQYLDLLRTRMTTAEDWRWVWDELAQVAESAFRFKELEEPARYASALSSAMHLYPPEEVLTGGELFTEFDAQPIADALALLRPHNLRIHMQAPGFAEVAEWKVEPVYGSEYAEEEIPEELYARLLTASSRENPQLRLPTPNPFIARSFELWGAPVPDANAARPTIIHLTKEAMDKASRIPPELIEGVPGMKQVWWKQDAAFFKPHAYVHLLISHPYTHRSPRAQVLSQLYAKAIRDSLNSYSYYASIAELQYTVNLSHSGIEISVWGFNDKIHVLVGAIVRRLADLRIAGDDLMEARFPVNCDQVKRNLQNFHKSQPYQHADYLADMVLLDGKWSLSAKIRELQWTIQGSPAVSAAAAVDAAGAPAPGAAAESDEAIPLTPGELDAYMQRTLSRGDLVLYAHGNLTRAQVLDLAKVIRESLPSRSLHDSERNLRRLARLPAGDGGGVVVEAEAFNSEDKNSACMNIMQVGPDALRQRALVLLLAQCCREACFDQLRTKEQLGYLVWSYLSCARGILSWTVCVQSGEYGPEYLDSRAEAFLVAHRAAMAGWTDERFEEHRQVCIQKAEEPFQTLNDEVSCWWHEILNERFIFDRDDRLAQVLRQITREEFLAFFDRHIAPDAPERRKLSVRIRSDHHRPEPNAVAAATQAENELQQPIVARRFRNATPDPDWSLMEIRNGLDLYPAVQAIYTKDQEP